MITEDDRFCVDEDGRLHNENGPAVIGADGTKRWFLHGKRHRIDGPAIEYPPTPGCIRNVEEWWVDGERHRIDGPAVIRSNGDEEWWKRGELHRENGPAKIRTYSGQEWYIKGLLHRVDGPAVIDRNGRTQWWVKGKHILKTDLLAIFRENNIRQDYTKWTDGEQTMFRLAMS